MQRTLRKTHETAGVALSAAPAAVELQPDSGDDAAARMPRSSTRAKVQNVADPFDPEDDRENCVRCGYVVEPERERRGLTTCAACAG